MSDQQSNGKHQVVSWTLPAPKDTRTALRYFWRKPRKPVTLTLNFKLHNLTKRKIRLLLEAFVHVTNVIATILKQWKEDDQQPRTDGAVAEVFKVQEKGVYGKYRSRTLSDVLSKYFGKSLDLEDTPLNDRLYQGAYRSVAQMLVGWAQNISAMIPHEEGTTLNMAQFYAGWTNIEAAYQRAMAVIVSLNLHPDYLPKSASKFQRRAKRDARWLVSRLRPEQDVRQALQRVEAMLGEDPSVLQRDAAYTEHVWQRDERHRRAVRENWLTQRILDKPGELTLLGMLHQNELEAFRDELYEVLAYIDHANALIKTIYGSPYNGYPAATKLPTLQEVLETFLHAKPHDFPTVQDVWIDNDPEHGLTVYPMPENEDENEEASSAAEEQDLTVHPVAENEDEDEALPAPKQHPLQKYQRHMGWFRLKKNVDKFRSEKGESDAVQDMFKALRELTPPQLQPLNFIGTTHPIHWHHTKDKLLQGQYRDFALLYRCDKKDEQETYQYVLVVFPHKKGQAAITEDGEEWAKRTKQYDEYQQRRQKKPLYYVNFPLTPFYPPKKSFVLLFPLECGEQYHEEYLKQSIKQQREAQKQAYRSINQKTQTHISLRRCLPEARIQSAKLSCEWNNQHQPEFHLHAHLTVPRTQPQPLPTCVLGVSMHDGVNAYAVMGFDGTVREVNDITVPEELDPFWGAKSSDDNYVHSIANSIVAMAENWKAYIALEDASWKKAQASVARDANGYLFSLPFRRIVTVIEYKSAMAGLMKPRLVSGVSPAYDCGLCRTRLEKGSKSTRNEITFFCPACCTEQHIDIEARNHVCSACRRSWRKAELSTQKRQYFSCTRCGAQPLLTRHNIAIVTAQKGLIQLIEHRKNSLRKA